MIAAAVLRSIFRRWYVVVVGMLLAAVCYAGFAHNSTTFQSVSTVVFVSPGAEPITGVDQVQTTSLVAFASTIERQMNDGRDVDRLASSSATIFGVGERKGYQVAVPNQGGQWNYYFPNPTLEIQVVGPTAGWVSATQARLVARIQAFANADQQKLGVKSGRMITAKLTSAVQPPQNVSATRSMRLRGLFVLGTVGLFLSASGAVMLDRYLERRRRRRHRTTSSPATPSSLVGASPKPRPDTLWKNSSL